MTELFTRAEYMASPGHGDPVVGMQLHRRYFAQFVNDDTIRRVVNGVGSERLLASTDPHLNDIPLGEWDALCGFRQRGSDIEWTSPGALPCNRISKELGTWMSPSDLVCIAKEAARQWIDNQREAP